MSSTGSLHNGPDADDSGAHAAAFSALFPASHRREVWLGGAAESDDSFPLTDGGDLPADRMFRAALTSRGDLKKGVIMYVKGRPIPIGPFLTEDAAVARS
jgi:hypothetical protein